MELFLDPTGAHTMPYTTGPSAHLFWAECACRDGTPYPLLWRTSRLVVLATEFEVFRAFLGDISIIIGSLYRTAAWNARVGGARASQHVQGRAMDCETPRSLTLGQFWQLARAHAARPSSQIRGLGYYPWGVHLDTRPSNRLSVWSGTRLDMELSVDDDPQ